MTDPVAEFHLYLYGPFIEGGELPTRFPSRFETALARLQTAFPKALIEPDGSVAWASPTHQLVAMIYDSGDAIEYVELRGHCRRSDLFQFVTELSGDDEIFDFAVMQLPERQWKNLQDFATDLPV
ncbi:MAG: hypothetical protein AAFU85_31770 [Planctomycetota bacterium]